MEAKTTPPNEPRLFYPGERARVSLYTSSHDRLHFEMWKDDIKEVVDLVFCCKIAFVTCRVAGDVLITRQLTKDGDRLIRIQDGELDVTCLEAHRFTADGSKRLFYVNYDLAGDSDSGRRDSLPM